MGLLKCLITHMARVTFPLDSTASGTATASGHNGGLSRTQHGRQHEFCWSKGRARCHSPPSPEQPASGTAHGQLQLSSSHSSPLTGAEASELGPGPANPIPEQHASAPPSSADPGLSRRPRVCGGLLLVLHCFPTKGFSKLLCVSLPP